MGLFSQIIIEKKSILFYVNVVFVPYILTHKRNLSQWSLKYEAFSCDIGLFWLTQNM